MKTKIFLSLILTVIAAAAVRAAGSDPTLDLKFDRPQKVTLGKTTLDFDGRIQDGMMFFGPKGYALPANGLVGEKVYQNPKPNL